MTADRSRRGADMMLGAGLVLAGMVAGVALFSGPGTSAVAAGGGNGDFGNSWLPAVPFQGDTVLAKESEGHYIIVSSSGWARPVKVRDSDLRSTPGESFVFAP